MVAMMLLMVVCAILMVCSWFAIGIPVAFVAVVIGMCSLRECRICHRFATLIRTGRHSGICPICSRMIVEGRQQELLERRSR